MKSRFFIRNLAEKYKKVFTEEIKYSITGPYV